MKSVVVYATKYGNTAKVAEAIADTLGKYGPVELVSAEHVRPIAHDTGLVVIGGPTEGHRMTDAMADFLRRTLPHFPAGTSAAAFDTRLRWPRWLSGSAASDIAKQLIRAHARLVAPEESFFVSGKATLAETPTLMPGELERASRWAQYLVSQVGFPVPA